MGDPATREAAGPGRSKHWKRSTHPSRRARKLYPLQSFPARAGLVPREPTARQHTQPPPVTKCSHTPIWSLSLITKNKRECPLLCKKVGPTLRRKRQRDRAGASIGSDPPPLAQSAKALSSHELPCALRPGPAGAHRPPTHPTSSLWSLSPSPLEPVPQPPLLPPTSSFWRASPPPIAACP